MRTLAWLAVLVTAASLLSLYIAIPFIHSSLLDTDSLYPTFARSRISFAPPVHESTLLRSPLSHHFYAHLLDRLHAGDPIRVAVLGGSISARDNWHTRDTPEQRYTVTFMQWLNEQFPIHPSHLTPEDEGAAPSPLLLRLSTFDGLFAADDPQKAAPVYSHKLLNVAAGGTGSQSASFCWTTLFTDTRGRLALPDLLLIDYAVNDAYMGLPGAMVEDSEEGNSTVHTLPLSPLHSFDRLIRSLLLTSQHFQQPTAILPLYFKAGSAKRHGSTQPAHDRVARHYGLPSVSYRDHALHPLTRQPFLSQPPYDEYPVIYSHDSYHPGVEGHRWMDLLIRRRLVALYDAYHHSQRSSLVDTWALSGHIAATSVRLSSHPSYAAHPRDGVTEMADEEVEDSWRWGSSVEGEDVGEWQQRVVAGQEREEWILPPILGLHPLPLPPALHPLHQELPSAFFCRLTYHPYLPEAWRLTYSEAALWFGVSPSTSAPGEALQPGRTNTSADGQWVFGAPARHPAKMTMSASEGYMEGVLRPEEERVGGEGEGEELPAMTIAFPFPLAHSVSVFYLRTPHVMGVAEAWLYCSREEEVRSEGVWLNGTWKSPASQATVSGVWMADDVSPTCYDRLRLQMRVAGEFHVIGYAAA